MAIYNTADNCHAFNVRIISWIIDYESCFGEIGVFNLDGEL